MTQEDARGSDPVPVPWSRVRREESGVQSLLPRPHGWAKLWPGAWWEWTEEGLRKVRAGFPKTQARRRDKMSGKQVGDLKIPPAAGHLHTRSTCG